MAGTMNGFAPSAFRLSQVAFRIVAMLATPRLPPVTATREPGLRRPAKFSLRISDVTAAATSATTGGSTFCRMRCILGSNMRGSIGGLRGV